MQRAAGVLILLPLMWKGAVAQRVSEAIVRGKVVERESGAPLDHAMVTLSPVGRQTFTDDSGRFALVAISRGSHTLRVTHLGHEPFSVIVRIADDSAIEPLRIALSRLTIQLASVMVLANPPCITPGPPNPAGAPELAALFDQITQNAAQFRFLSDSFPFEYHMERTLRTLVGAGTVAIVEIDTLVIRSDENRWTYRAGGVVSGGSFGSERILHLPTLTDLASTSFQQNHCFHYLGTKDSGDTHLIEIGFRAANRIRGPDVHGIVWLDASTFRIQKMEMELSAIPSAAKNLAALRVTTLFREVARSIPVFDEIRAVREYRVAPSGLDPTGATEMQRLIHFAWRRRAPGRAE